MFKQIIANNRAGGWRKLNREAASPQRRQPASTRETTQPALLRAEKDGYIPAIDFSTGSEQPVQFVLAGAELVTAGGAAEPPDAVRAPSPAPALADVFFAYDRWCPKLRVVLAMSRSAGR